MERHQISMEDSQCRRANIIQNPIQSLYNRFNKKERLKRKLEKNRRKYGEEEEWR